MVAIPLLLIAVVVLLLNIKASLLILDDSLSEPKQRILQLLITWLLPLFGAILVLGVHRPLEKTNGKYPDEAPPPDDFPNPKAGSRLIGEVSDDD